MLMGFEKIEFVHGEEPWVKQPRVPKTPGIQANL